LKEFPFRRDFSQGCLGIYFPGLCYLGIQRLLQLWSKGAQLSLELVEDLVSSTYAGFASMQKATVTCYGGFHQMSKESLQGQAMCGKIGVPEGSS
jgi:hypothetical protein